MGRRGVGRRLNDQERMEILDVMSREHKVKNVDLAKQYGVSEGAIRKLKQMKDRIRDRYTLGNVQNRDKRKRGTFVRSAQFEQELYEWICRMRESQAYQVIPLTQTAVRQQAMLFAKNHEGMDNFKASAGWFARFCSRHRLDPPPCATLVDGMCAMEGSSSSSTVENTTSPILDSPVGLTSHTLLEKEDHVKLDELDRRSFVVQGNDGSVALGILQPDCSIKVKVEPHHPESLCSLVAAADESFTDASADAMKYTEYFTDDGTHEGRPSSFLISSISDDVKANIADDEPANDNFKRSYIALNQDSCQSKPTAINSVLEDTGLQSDEHGYDAKRSTRTPPKTSHSADAAIWNDDEVFSLGL